MTAKSKFVFVFGIALAGSILFLFIGAFRGKVLQEASLGVSWPVVKLRKMQTDPASLIGLLGTGEVLYRAEYYPRKGARMTACASLEGESQYAGKKVNVNWLTMKLCEIKVDGVVVFRWSGREWQRP